MSSVAQLHGVIKNKIQTKTNKEKNKQSELAKNKFNALKKYYAYLPGFKPCVYQALNMTKKKAKFEGVYNRKTTAINS